MKFKEQIDNRYIFDGGNGEELELTQECTNIFKFKNLWITKELKIKDCDGMWSPYKDIQTAVNLMQILKDEGVV